MKLLVKKLKKLKQLSQGAKDSMKGVIGRAKERAADVYNETKDDVNSAFKTPSTESATAN